MLSARTGLILTFALILILFGMAAVDQMMSAAASVFDLPCVSAADHGATARCPAAHLAMQHDRESIGSSAFGVAGQ